MATPEQIAAARGKTTIINGVLVNSADVGKFGLHPAEDAHKPEVEDKPATEDEEPKTRTRGPARNKVRAPEGNK